MYMVFGFSIFANVIFTIFLKTVFNFVLLKDFFRSYNVVEWGNAYGNRLET